MVLFGISGSASDALAIVTISALPVEITESAKYGSFMRPVATTGILTTFFISSALFSNIALGVTEGDIRNSLEEYVP